jgi:XrtJ-associated TM-motif-TM protein
MTKSRYAVVLALALLSATITLHAQSGCLDSPEAPTALLLIVGSIGIFYGPYMLRRVLRRSGKR